MGEKLQLEVKSYGSSDYDLESWEPAIPEDVYFVLDVEIGEAGDDRADLFYVTVATPEAARTHLAQVGATRSGPLVVAEYCLDELLDRVRTLVDGCAARTWEESVRNLQQYFEYEYADYVPEEA